VSKFEKWLLYPIILPVVKMPGSSYRGPFVALTHSQKVLRERLEKRVDDLARRIGERSIEKYLGMVEAMNYMGSFAYARSCYERRNDITAMLSLEMLDMYYPKTGDFIAFVGGRSSRP
jgi:hypothetical protein